MEVTDRILIDDVAWAVYTKSYKAKSLCRCLHLKLVRKRRLHLNAFVNRTFKDKTCEIQLQKVVSSD